MNNMKSAGKFELIEQALQEAVGGGIPPIDLCGGSCHILSWDVCDVNLCSIGDTKKPQ